jgi:hypothetical protein
MSTQTKAEKIMVRVHSEQRLKGGRTLMQHKEFDVAISWIEYKGRAYALQEILDVGIPALEAKRAELLIDAQIGQSNSTAK